MEKVIGGILLKLYIYTAGNLKKENKETIDIELYVN
jgi:hypothetical protein